MPRPYVTYLYNKASNNRKAARRGRDPSLRYKAVMPLQSQTRKRPLPIIIGAARMALPEFRTDSYLYFVQL